LIQLGRPSQPLEGGEEVSICQGSDLRLHRFVTTQAEFVSLLFAWEVAKHVKSNAIVLARSTKTVGIGMGQTSRVDSVFMAIKRAGKRAHGAVMASDAFFPKPDNIALAKKAGIKAIIQPGGSIADQDVIRAADRAKIAMVLTGVRHFKH